MFIQVLAANRIGLSAGDVKYIKPILPKEKNKSFTFLMNTLNRFKYFLHNAKY